MHPKLMVNIINTLSKSHVELHMGPGGVKAYFVMGAPEPRTEVRQEILRITRTPTDITLTINNNSLLIASVSEQAKEQICYAQFIYLIQLAEYKIMQRPMDTIEIIANKFTKIQLEKLQRSRQ